MAANFSSTEDICERENCQSVTDVTYYVKEKKKLCDDCASTEECIGKARKGRPNLYCEKHDGEEIKLYCTTHNVAVCQLCAMIDHHDPSCVRQDIEGAIMDSRAKINILKEKAKEKLELCRVYGDHIHQCRKDTNTYLQALKDEVDSVINEAVQTDKDKEKEDLAKINQEIDEKNQNLREEIQQINEKIRKNDEEREKRIELNRSYAEKRREPIDNKQQDLQTDIKNIAEEKERKISELEKAWQDKTKTTETTIQKLDTVLENDENVVKDGHHVKISVRGELKKPLNKGEVKQVTDTILGVRFVKGAGREKYDGRIDGYDGEWKLIDTINDKIKFPAVVGYLDECNVIITDRLSGSRHTYMLDINTKNSRRVITGRGTSLILSCALLNDDKIVCGKYSEGCTENSLTECISVYDRQWKHINDVTIPKNTTFDKTRVDVAVDQDGMIIAAEWVQSKIYVINPADGNIINTIACKDNIILRGVLSSGHIIARPSPPDHKLYIIDRQGAQREIPHSGVIQNACIDPMTDDLYVVTSDEEYKTCMIDQVMSGSDMKKRRVASFPLSTKLDNRKRYFKHSRVMMTSSGKLIASDADNILVFKNRFTL
ncbi:uncharacterized protein LOC105447408 [Strongylocentrotus purpuratus]|uniref:B box-type domain-containing protein n=1 Tax=Strongylocentrotus purpuratus TaxID=7668 RepID=A0A7M7HN27_STRPU|nr:uncharacterized protein LOC105447408 [Strongylocentrotus purpuratus]|eukprot:XP_011683710.1 PREDICTED: uncharacterized protein LOC105447408 [Strongylocentrotus purpuratus]